MQELKPEEFYRVKKNIGFENLSPEPISVILCNNPGNVYVDDSKNPKSALIWSQGIEGFYLIGDEKNNDFNAEINSFIDEIITPMLKQKGYDYLEVSPCNKSWYKTIEEVFKSRKIDTWNQLTYIWDKASSKRSNKCRLNYNVRSIKDNQFDIHQLSNKEYLFNTLLLFWNSIEELKEKGSCYYAVKDNKVIGICYTGFIGHEKKAIGIETNKEYRRKGVAYNLASKCIDEILEGDRIPYWDCMEENIPSKLLAEKLGFKKLGKYVCYGFPV